METFSKQCPTAQAAEREAAGLAWLASADGGPRLVAVLERSGSRLTLERIDPGTPTPQSAHRFGAALARMHAAGAPGWGAPPPGTSGHGTIGLARLATPPSATDYPQPGVQPHHRSDAPETNHPATQPGEFRGGAGQSDSQQAQHHQPPSASTARASTWGEFYAAYRLQPHLDSAVVRGAVSRTQRSTFQAVIDALLAGHLDHPQPALLEPNAPARIHGDLWSGNVLWDTASEAVLIDPAAHGGHAETDLAMLALFGAPHLEQIVLGYQSVSPLALGWQRRIPLHQLHPLLVHAELFGGGYGAQAAAAAERALR